MPDIDKYNVANQLNKNNVKMTVTESFSKLTKKNRCFLELIASGKSTQEAHMLAGYRGGITAAYELRNKLKKNLEDILEGEGWDRVGMRIRIRRMLEEGMPPEGTKLHPNVWLKYASFYEKLSETDIQDRPKISPFIVAINEPKEVKIESRNESI